MPTSRPLVEGDRVVAISRLYTVGATYLFNPRRMDSKHFVLCSDFDLPNHQTNNWWEVVGTKVFGIANSAPNDVRLQTPITNRTAPGLYVREGDDTSNWEEYRQVLARRVAEATGVVAISRLYTLGELVQRHGHIPLSISAAELAEIGITPPPPPPPPPPPSPTRFNLLECDLPAVAPPPAKQKNFDALAELQAEFRAAKVTAKTTVQPALTRFDLLECDEPVEPVVVKPKWSAPQRPKQQPQSQQRRTVEDILDLTTSGPLEALAALQIAKAEILRELRQKETN